MPGELGNDRGGPMEPLTVLPKKEQPAQGAPGAPEIRRLPAELPPDEEDDSE